MQEHDPNTDVLIDTAVAGGVITMPYWAIALNEWLHLFLAFCGSILVIYRMYVMFREITKN